jgi:chromosome segregation ATPase
VPRLEAELSILRDEKQRFEKLLEERNECVSKQKAEKHALDLVLARKNAEITALKEELKEVRVAPCRSCVEAQSAISSKETPVEKINDPPSEVLRPGPSHLPGSRTTTHWQPEIG